MKNYKISFCVEILLHSSLTLVRLHHGTGSVTEDTTAQLRSKSLPKQGLQHAFL